MAKKDKKDLLKFLKPFDKGVADIVMQLREFLWDLYPTANELIYDNYNALAVGWSPTDRVGHIFCTLAAGRTSGNVHFGFYWGSKLKEPKGILLGKGNQYRYLLVTDPKVVQQAYIRGLVKQAYAYSMGLVKDPGLIMKGKTIVKSISAKKRQLTKGSPKRK